MTIDWWTLALQTVNFLVLVWILARFFFRPMSAIVARRQAEAAKALADADAARRAGGQARRPTADRRAPRSRPSATACWRRRAPKPPRNGPASSPRPTTPPGPIGAEAAAAIERERAAMEAGLVDRIRGLALEIARRLVERLPPAAIARRLRRRSSAKRCQRCEPETRAVFTAAATARSTSSPRRRSRGEETDRVRAALEKAFGAPLALSFRADPAVIAGIELNSRHAFIRSSWRDDLDRIGKVLTLDAKPAG